MVEPGTNYSIDVCPSALQQVGPRPCLQAPGCCCAAMLPATKVWGVGVPACGVSAPEELWQLPPWCPPRLPAPSVYLAPGLIVPCGSDSSHQGQQ